MELGVGPLSSVNAFETGSPWVLDLQGRQSLVDQRKQREDPGRVMVDVHRV